jgi:hypothetical protein
MIESKVKSSVTLNPKSCSHSVKILATEGDIFQQYENMTIIGNSIKHSILVNPIFTELLLDAGLGKQISNKGGM